MQDDACSVVKETRPPVISVSQWESRHHLSLTQHIRGMQVVAVIEPCEALLCVVQTILWHAPACQWMPWQSRLWLAFWQGCPLQQPWICPSSWAWLHDHPAQGSPAGFPLCPVQPPSQPGSHLPASPPPGHLRSRAHLDGGACAQDLQGDAVPCKNQTHMSGIHHWVGSVGSLAQQRRNRACATPAGAGPGQEGGKRGSGAGTQA